MNHQRFKDIVWNYYRAHGRNTLPWRRTKNPYRILVSEIMLQQTQVDRVIQKYRLFLKKFPSFKALAQAPLRDVLLEWKGLGYNRRGLNLKRLAQIIVTEHAGKLPHNRETLMKLPGIGPYTAGAIMAFVWNTPETFIETNIRTAYIHHFFSKATKQRGDKTVSDAELMPLIEKTLDTKNPREWYYALMDYGSHLKKTVGNISKKSSTYTKQSKFEGSRRQLRALILHEVALHESLTKRQLARKIKENIETVESVVAELANDRFISVHKNNITINV